MFADPFHIELAIDKWNYLQDATHRPYYRGSNRKSNFVLTNGYD